MAYACIHAGSSLHVREHLERESRRAALKKKRKTAKSTAAVQGTNAPATSTAPAAPGRHERLLDELKRVDRVLQRGARSILIHALWRESCQVSLQGQDPHPDGTCVRFRGEEAFNRADCRTTVRRTFTDLLKRLNAQYGRPGICDRYCTPLAGTLYWQALHHQGSVLQASVTPVMVAAQASRAQLQAVGKCAGAPGPGNPAYLALPHALEQGDAADQEARASGRGPESQTDTPLMDAMHSILVRALVSASTESNSPSSGHDEAPPPDTCAEDWPEPPATRLSEARSSGSGEETWHAENAFSEEEDALSDEALRGRASSPSATHTFAGEENAFSDEALRVVASASARHRLCLHRETPTSAVGLQTAFDLFGEEDGASAGRGEGGKELDSYGSAAIVTMNTAAGRLVQRDNDTPHAKAPPMPMAGAPKRSPEDCHATSAAPGEFSRMLAEYVDRKTFFLAGAMTPNAFEHWYGRWPGLVLVAVFCILRLRLGVDLVYGWPASQHGGHALSDNALGDCALGDTLRDFAAGGLEVRNTLAHFYGKEYCTVLWVHFADTLPFTAVCLASGSCLFTFALSSMTWRLRDVMRMWMLINLLCNVAGVIADLSQVLAGSHMSGYTLARALSPGGIAFQVTSKRDLLYSKRNLLYSKRNLLYSKRDLLFS